MTLNKTILTAVLMCSAGITVADDFVDDIPDVPASVMRSTEIVQKMVRQFMTSR
jgi:hypothetical protein